MVDHATRLHHLETYITDLERQLVDVQARLDNVMRMGRVMKTDPQNGTVDIAWGKDENGEWVTAMTIPWGTRAGKKIKVWNPPSVGEQIAIFSMGGEVGEGSSFGMQGYFSRENKQNHNKDDELRINVDKSEIHITGTGVTIKGDTVTIKAKNIKLKADKIEQDQKGPTEETPDPILPPLNYPTEAPPGLQGEVPTS